MKNVILLSPNFPPSFKGFPIALKKSGARVLGIDDQPYYGLAKEIKSNMTEYYKVNDLHNYDELVKAVAFFIHKYGKISILDSHNEYWLETEARLRDDFNIPGLRVKDMKAIKCKSEMKKVYKKLGLRVAEGKLVKSREDAEEFLKKYGYPAVLKPDSGIGAENTYKLTCDEDVEKAFNEITKFPYIIEEFISGLIHSFDGIADDNSDPVFCTSHVFSSGVMDAVNKNDHIYYFSVRDIPEKLEEAGRKCLKGFNVKNRFFHLEFFNTPNGEFVPLEVNIRPSGGFAVDMYNYASDFNVFQVWSELVIHKVNKIDYSRKYFVCYIGRKDNITYIHPHEEVLKRFPDEIKMKNPIPKVLRNAMGDYMYLARAEDLSKIMEVVDFIQATK